MTEFVPAELLSPVRHYTPEEAAGFQRTMRRRRMLFFAVVLVPVIGWVRFRSLRREALETGIANGATLWLALTLLSALVAAGLVYRTLFCPACHARLTRNRERRCTACGLSL